MVEDRDLTQGIKVLAHWGGGGCSLVSGRRLLLDVLKWGYSKFYLME